MSQRSTGDPPVRAIIDALAASVDGAELVRRLRPLWPSASAAPSAPPVAAQAAGELSAAASKLQSRIGLADILDDSILNARPSDHAFPLRLLFGELVTDSPNDDVAFALASGLNLYFRAQMAEEAKAVVALELSRLYYDFAARALEPALTVQLSPLLAKLLSTELSQLCLESVDHIKVFDSVIHERAPRADASSASVRQPLSFLCRVASNNRPRFKAAVLT